MHVTNVLFWVSIILFGCTTQNKPDTPSYAPEAVSEPAITTPKRYLGQPNTIRALVYSHAAGYREVDTPELNRFLVLLGDDNGIEVTVTEHPLDLMADNLERYDVLILQSASNLGKYLPDYARTDVEKWFEEGHGIFAIHTVEAGSSHWPWFYKLVGTDFSADSDVLPLTLIVDEENKDHPAVAGWGPRLEIEASLHTFDRTVTGLPGIKVLLRADEATFEPVRAAFAEGGRWHRGQKPMGDHPVAWTNTAGKGRMLYTNLGHDVHSIDTDFGHQHFVESIKWVAEASICDRSVPLPRRCDTPCPNYENQITTPRDEGFYKKYRLAPKPTKVVPAPAPRP